MLCSKQNAYKCTYLMELISLSIKQISFFGNFKNVLSLKKVHIHNNTPVKILKCNYDKCDATKRKFSNKCLNDSQLNISD